MATSFYELAADCELTETYLALADLASGEDQRKENLQMALASSLRAYDLYRSYGYIQIIECLSEEVIYRHSLALRANNSISEAGEFLEQAYHEMMRKYQLIPADDPLNFRKTYLENIPLHREINLAYKNAPAPA